MRIDKDNFYFQLLFNNWRIYKGKLHLPIIYIALGKNGFMINLLFICMVIRIGKSYNEIKEK